MTSYFYSTSFDRDGSNITPGADGSDNLFIGPDATITVANVPSSGAAALLAGSYNHAIIEGTLVSDNTALFIGNAAGVDINQVDVRLGAELIGFALFGIQLTGTGSAINNAGYIYGRAAGVDLTLGTSAYGPSESTLVNTGTIEGGDWGLEVGFSSSETLVVTNSGTLKGQLASLKDLGTGAAQLITNSGKMIGAVLAGDGDDRLDTRLGTVQGNIDLGAGSDTAYGSAAADSIQGGTENDVIRGNGGKDILDGGDGTQDYIDFSDKTTKVEVTLLAPGVTGTAMVNGVVEDTFKNFEAVIGGKAGDLLTGNFGSNNIAGGDGNDTAIGAAGNDSIFGGNGNDLIAGGLGNDQLTGNAGADLFRFNSTLSTSANLDTITDFVHASDEIQLDDAIFTALTSPWSSAQFKASASGHVPNTANQHVLYDQSTGVLWYDPDGSGAGTQTAFAKLGTSSHPTIDWTDFAII